VWSVVNKYLDWLRQYACRIFTSNAAIDEIKTLEPLTTQTTLKKAKHKRKNFRVVCVVCG
jgi:hypothetical protein